MRKHVGWLLIVPVVVPLLPWLYNRRTPAIFGIPFFYWYQLLMVPLGSAVVWLVITLGGGLRGQPGERPGNRGGGAR